jgi:hypothetical protein
MDQQQRRNVEEASQRLAKSMRGSYKSAVEATIAIQEISPLLAQYLLESHIQLLRMQDPTHFASRRRTLKRLEAQARRQRKTLQDLSRESFLKYLSSSYPEMSDEASSTERGNRDRAESDLPFEQPRPRLPLFSGKDPTLARRFEEELHGFGG